MARTVVSRLRLVVLGGQLGSKLRSPLRGLLGLAPVLIKLQDPLAGLGQIVLARCGNPGRVPLHPLVAFDQESLGLIELLRVVLAPQALAEQALAAEPVPVVGSPVARQVVAQQREGALLPRAYSRKGWPAQRSELVPPERHPSRTF